jgi:sucrose phosphorylase
MSSLIQRIARHVALIYADILNDAEQAQLAQQLLAEMDLSPDAVGPDTHRNLWSERDIAVISYGDTFLKHNEKPLVTLKYFLDHYLHDVVSIVHILPYFPWTSDDGFAVLDYSTVNEALGDWGDITAIAEHYRLMSDLVINHCSSRSVWFENFKADREPGRDYFIAVDPGEDLSMVVRPRTSPLLIPFDTAKGEQYIWCTFGPDQVDFNFANPQVLIEFVRIIHLHLSQGVRVFRLDAVAFLWKRLQTTCINLDETHEIIRLLRTLVEHAEPTALLITETNIPNKENLTYFGNANEAHAIYNFSLPPLLVYTLLSGDSRYLTQWLTAMPPAQHGTTYFNFIASHDGIGLRPVEGLLSDAETEQFIQAMMNFGGQISWRSDGGGRRKAYEINIALFDALQGTVAGRDDLGIERFLCAHTIMLGLEGIPAFYVHSLVGTPNDFARMQNTGHNRSINRHQWDAINLDELLADPSSHHHQVFVELRRRIFLRRQQRAFHPNATQFTLQLGGQLFGFWRESIDRCSRIFCIHNISPQPQRLHLGDLNLTTGDCWHDVLSAARDLVSSEEFVLAPYQCLWLVNAEV